MDSLDTSLEITQIIKKCECSQTHKILVGALQEILRISMSDRQKLESRLQAIEENGFKVVKGSEGQATLDMSTEVDDGDGVEF